MNKQIYIVNGKPRAGKDTFAKFLGEIISVKKISIVDPVKNIAKNIGWDGTKTEKDRKFLSDLKMLLGDYNDYNFKYVSDEIKKFYDNDNEMVMLIDAREHKDIDRICHIFGASSIFIRNDNVESVKSNIADAQVEDHIYDYVIMNNSTIDIFKKNVSDFAFGVVMPKLKMNGNTILEKNEYQKLAIKTNNNNSFKTLMEFISNRNCICDEVENINEFNRKSSIIDSLLGLSGEVGEVVDILKKNIFHKKELDKEHLISEMGDVMWYMALLAESIGTDLNYVMNKNIEKLSKRYPNGFNFDRANNREENDI